MRTKRWTAYGRRYSAWRAERSAAEGRTSSCCPTAMRVSPACMRWCASNPRPPSSPISCERRSIFVAGAEVRSGEEVRLAVGDEVRIGPYVLHSVVPGSPFVPVAAVPAPVPAPAPEPVSAPAPVANPSSPASAAGVPVPVSVPVAIPVANVPQGEGLTVVPSPPVAMPAAGTGEGLAAAAASAEEDDNPFAMLGRVEGPAIAASAPSRAPAPAALPTALDCAHTRVRPRARRRTCAAIPVRVHACPGRGPWFRRVARIGDSGAFRPGSAGQCLVPGGAAGQARRGTGPRALVIPEDFDLFAVDPPQGRGRKKDAWGSGLQAKSLSEIANMRHDELLQSLPASGAKFAHDMDNPAHAGLPKALDPRDELDPLRLFTGGSDAASALVPERSAMVLGSGSDLSQSFSLPRGVQAPVGPGLPGAAEVPGSSPPVVQGAGTNPGMASAAPPAPSAGGPAACGRTRPWCLRLRFRFGRSTGLAARGERARPRCCRRAAASHAFRAGCRRCEGRAHRGGGAGACSCRGRHACSSPGAGPRARSCAHRLPRPGWGRGHPEVAPWLRCCRNWKPLRQRSCSR